jgi:eukaryotic-like serine/threonine-protein kinase
MRPAHQLEGLVLDGKWAVRGLAPRQKNATGGYFSIGYIVVGPEGREAFLKAMDYELAVQSPIDMAVMLNSLTQSYLFEKKLCLRCKDQHLKRVVHAIDSGTIRLNSADPLSTVEYLIFEKADADIRTHLDRQAKLDVAFGLRALHHVTVGLSQLHSVEVAHQDLKPSNVLFFPGEGSKIGDLGRAWVKGMPAPHDDARPCAGDRSYAPPELMYNQVSADERVRRFGCDLYHLGSLATFIFARAQMNALFLKQLDRAHWPNVWGGTYPSVLPYVQAAYAYAIAEFRLEVRKSISLSGIADELVKTPNYWLRTRREGCLAGQTLRTLLPDQSPLECCRQ